MAFRLGTFRNVRFLTRSATTTFGRRTATYELPFDEKGVAHIDLGRAPRKFQITAILISLPNEHRDGYMRRRDQFVEALERPGPGLLDHPFYGRHMVVIDDDISITESVEHGGVAEITFSAVEARDPVPPDTSVAGLLDAVRSCRDVANSVMEGLATVGPDFIYDSVFADLDIAINALRRANALVSSLLSTPAALSSRLDAISRELDQLIQTPRKLYDSVDAFIESLMLSAGRVFDNFASSVDGEDVPALDGATKATDTVRLLDFEAEMTPIPRYNTAARTVQKQNRARIVQSLTTSVIANGVLSLAENPPTSRSEALDVRQRLSEYIVAQAEGSVEGIDMPADLYDALKELLASLQIYLERVAGTLVDVRTHTTAAPIPLEVLTYQLLGNAERTEEMLERNPHIAHQGMVPPNTTIEVPTS